MTILGMELKDILGVIAAGVQALTGAVTVWFVSRQTKILSRQTEIQDRSLLAAEKAANAAETSSRMASQQFAESIKRQERDSRAVLLIDGFSNVRFDADGKVHSLRIGPKWKNFGVSAAVRVVSVTNFIAVNEKYLPIDFTFPDFNFDKPYPRVVGPQGIALGPNIDLSFDVLKRAIMKENSIFIYGWAEYDDVYFGTDRHRTEFCKEIVITNLPISGEIEFDVLDCPIYNGFDIDTLRTPKTYQGIG